MTGFDADPDKTFPVEISGTLKDSLKDFVILMNSPSSLCISPEELTYDSSKGLLRCKVLARRNAYSGEYIPSDVGYLPDFKSGETIGDSTSGRVEFGGAEMTQINEIANWYHERGISTGISDVTSFIVQDGVVKFAGVSKCRLDSLDLSSDRDGIVDLLERANTESIEDSSFVAKLPVARYKGASEDFYKGLPRDAMKSMLFIIESIREKGTIPNKYCYFIRVYHTLCRLVKANPQVTDFLGFAELAYKASYLTSLCLYTDVLGVSSDLPSISMSKIAKSITLDDIKCVPLVCLPTDTSDSNIGDVVEASTTLPPRS
uniref:Uncharacterized protein n=1 Tax=viral metagenome TaxID=1070528 RepID=A0A6C0JTM0_9ZZZZ